MCINIPRLSVLVSEMCYMCPRDSEIAEEDRLEISGAFDAIPDPLCMGKLFYDYHQEFLFYQYKRSLRSCVKQRFVRGEVKPYTVKGLLQCPIYTSGKPKNANHTSKRAGTDFSNG